MTNTKIPADNLEATTLVNRVERTISETPQRVSEMIAENTNTKYIKEIENNFEDPKEKSKGLLEEVYGTLDLRGEITKIIEKHGLKFPIKSDIEILDDLWYVEDELKGDQKKQYDDAKRRVLFYVGELAREKISHLESYPNLLSNVHPVQAYQDLQAFFRGERR